MVQRVADVQALLRVLVSLAARWELLAREFALHYHQYVRGLQLRHRLVTLAQRLLVTPLARHVLVLVQL